MKIAGPYQTSTSIELSMWPATRIDDGTVIRYKVPHEQKLLDPYGDVLRGLVERRDAPSPTDLDNAACSKVDVREPKRVKDEFGSPKGAGVVEETPSGTASDEWGECVSSVPASAPASPPQPAEPVPKGTAVKVVKMATGTGKQKKRTLWKTVIPGGMKFNRVLNNEKVATVLGGPGPMRDVSADAEAVCVKGLVNNMKSSSRLQRCATFKLRWCYSNKNPVYVQLCVVLFALGMNHKHDFESWRLMVCGGDPDEDAGQYTRILKYMWDAYGHTTWPVVTQRRVIPPPMAGGRGVGRGIDRGRGRGRGMGRGEGDADVGWVEGGDADVGWVEGGDADVGWVEGRDADAVAVEDAGGVEDAAVGAGGVVGGSRLGKQTHQDQRQRQMHPKSRSTQQRRRPPHRPRVSRTIARSTQLPLRWRCWVDSCSRPEATVEEKVDKAVRELSTRLHEVGGELRCHHPHAGVCDPPVHSECPWGWTKAVAGPISGARGSRPCRRFSCHLSRRGCRSPTRGVAPGGGQVEPVDTSMCST